MQWQNIEHKDNLYKLNAAFTSTVSPSLTFFFNLLYSFLSAHRFLSIGLAVKYWGPWLGHGEAAFSLSSNYIFIMLLFEEPRHFAPTRVLFRLCKVCLLPEYVSETEQIHVISGDARLSRRSTAGSWEPPGLQKPSATGCHRTCITVPV